MAILRQAEGGMPVLDLCREHQMRGLEDENRRLRKMFSEFSMQNELLKESLEKNDPAIPAPGNDRDCGGAMRGQYCFSLPNLWAQRDALSLWPHPTPPPCRVTHKTQSPGC